MKAGEIITFDVKKNFTFIKKLGEGGTGDTHLFKDDTMAFEQIGTQGVYYNAYSGSEDVYRYNGDCHDFLGHYGGSNAVVIMIFEN